MTGGDRQATESSSPSPAAPRATVSPLPLATDLRSADDRDLPSRTDALGAALSDTIGGPIGRHALIGRTRIMTPVRVMFAIALVFLALGWTTKSPCLQTVGTGTADQTVVALVGYPDSTGAIVWQALDTTVAEGSLRIVFPTDLMLRIGHDAVLAVLSR